jgi:hypothetical protein
MNNNARSSKLTLVDSLSQFKDKLAEKIEILSSPGYEPTGLQEDIILNFGKGKHQIIVALHPNDVGKTTAGVNIFKNLIWPHDPQWFSFWDGKSIFRDREFPLKRFRIASEHNYLADTGAIQIEIGNWWPKGRYNWEKGGKPYPSQCVCDTGWSGDAMAYTQDRKTFESIKLDVLWTDEPPDPDLIGAMTSRFREADQMLWLITATPIKCGPFLDVISDLKDKGTRVKYLTGTAYENSITTGKPNHLGTKRGMRSNESIEAKIATTPLDERDARCFGKSNSKAGRIYYDFDRNIHVKDFDLSSDYAKSWNCFMSMDPHPKAFPFIQWWAKTPDKKEICYNEWPTVEFLQGNFYDEIRTSLVCNYDAEMIAKFIKIYDGTQFGLSMFKRFIDPRPARQSEHNYGKTNESLLMQYAKWGIDFECPPAQLIEVQRDEIRKGLKYDKQVPICDFNEPSTYYMPHCQNSIRMIDRHYWDEDSECEAERYKEGPDCHRFFKAGTSKHLYQKPNTVEQKTKKRIVKNPIVEAMQKQLADVSLG